MAGQCLQELTCARVPQGDHPRPVAGGEEAIVRTESDAPRLAGATHEDAPDLARRHIPEPRRAVVPGSSQPMTVVAEGNAVHPARLTLQPSHLPIGLPVPDDDRAWILGSKSPDSLGRGQARPVGAECDRGERRMAGSQDVHRLARQCPRCGSCRRSR